MKRGRRTYRSEREVESKVDPGHECAGTDVSAGSTRSCAKDTDDEVGDDDTDDTVVVDRSSTVVPQKHPRDGDTDDGKCVENEREAEGEIGGHTALFEEEDVQVGNGVTVPQLSYPYTNLDFGSTKVGPSEKVNE